MFRILLKLSAIGQILGQILLLGFLIALFLPLLPALGLSLNPNPANLNTKHLMSLTQSTYYAPILTAFLISLVTGYFCVLLALITGFFTRHTYPGKFLLLAIVSFLLFLPDFLSFMNGTSILATLFGNKSVQLFTHASGFIWGYALALLFSYSYLERMNNVEVEITISLGGNQANILFQYLLPRSKNFITYLGAFLTTSFFAQGFYTYYAATGKNITMYHQIFEPVHLYGDPGPGSAIFLVILIVGLAGSFLFIKYANLEYSDRKTPKAAKTKARKATKRVTRKAAPASKKVKEKKKSKKKDSKEGEEETSLDSTEPIEVEPTSIGEESNNNVETDVTQEATEPVEGGEAEISTEDNPNEEAKS